MDKLILENFKVFREPINLDLAPITILTGKNSAGKSSVIKALLLLSDFLARDNQLSLGLLEGNAVKHRINKWGNVRNWKSGDAPVRLGYAAAGLEFQYTFGGEAEDIFPVLLEFSLRAEGIDEPLALRRRSEKVYDLEVTLAFLEILSAPQWRGKSALFSNRRKLEERLKEVEQEKILTDDRTKLLALVQEEQSLQSRLDTADEDAYHHTAWFNIPITIDDDTGRRQTIAALIRRALQAELTQIEDSRAVRIIDADNEPADDNGEADNRHDGETASLREGFRFESRQRIARIANGLQMRMNTGGYFSALHLSPNRAEQARLYYRFQHQSDFGHLINWYAKTWLDGAARDFMKKWLPALGIGRSLKVEDRAGEAAEVTVEPVEGGERRDLADLGYGTGQVLTILLAILAKSYDEGPASERHHALRTQAIRRGAVILIEEPEANLHPALQSKLAEMLFEAHKIFGTQFIIETHSEYLIRRLQVMVADSACDMQPTDAVIYYVRLGEQGSAEPLRISIDGDGVLSDAFDEGFFDEADTKSMDLYRIQKKKERAE